MSRLVACALLVLFAACPPPTPPASIGYFRATPDDITPGDSVQLTWQSFDAPSCTIAPDVGEVLGTGASLVTPQETTTYALDCAGAKRTLTVTVKPKFAITRFTARDPQVVTDGITQLEWDTVTAASCAIEPKLGEVPLTGTLTVIPAATTTYTLTCKGTTVDGPTTLSAKTTVTTVDLTTALDAPANVSVTAHDGWLHLEWTQAQGSAVLYLAEAAGIDPATFDTLPGHVVFRRLASPFDVTGLVNGRAYFVRLQAMSGATTSALTPELTATPVDGPRVEDPFFSEQWHLSYVTHEDVDVLPPWADDVRGQGVKVAVVDEGVDLSHRDLFQNGLTGFHKDYLVAAPRSLAEHGSCVAGLIGARDWNGVGVRGVAPRAGLMSFNVLQSLTSLAEYDAMTRNEDVVSVSNNSWGDAPDGTGDITLPDPQWLRGVTEGATQGRGGKGVVYFWASGNGADGVSQGGVVDDSNFDSQANSRFVFAVGGVGRDGKKASYAEGGANVLIAAPTEGDDGVGLTTTDITGGDGYNTGTDTREHRDPDYTKTFNGTSAATPVAAGVGALVLQARPELSYRDVRRVLARSARKNDATSGGWATNAAGLHVHHGYGFGVVDAKAAVALARTIPLVGPEVKAEANLTPALAIPDDDATGVTSSAVIASSGIGQLDVAEVEVTITHANSSDLELVLEKSGSVSDVLYPQHQCASASTGQGAPCSDIDHFVFTTVRHLDEPADGTWTLRVTDRRAGTTGQLVSWSLRLYGSP